MGNSLVRYKAELDFDGRELTRFYLDKQDLNLLLEVCVVDINSSDASTLKLNFKILSFFLFFVDAVVRK